MKQSRYLGIVRLGMEGYVEGVSRFTLRTEHPVLEAAGDCTWNGRGCVIRFFPLLAYTPEVKMAGKN